MTIDLRWTPLYTFLTPVSKIGSVLLHLSNTPFPRTRWKIHKSPKFIYVLTTVFCCRLFCTKHGKIDSNQLPSCADTLRTHSLQANYQAAIWRRSLKNCPQVSKPTDHVWVQDDSSPAIKWISGEPASAALLEFLSCSRTRSYVPLTCSWISNGLKCTDICRLQDCANRSEEKDEEEQDPANDQENDCSDDDEDAG